jgi:hypothetical protein
MAVNKRVWKDNFMCCDYSWNLQSIQDDRELTNNLYTMKFEVTSENKENVPFETHIKNIVTVISEIIEHLQLKHSIYQSFGLFIDHHSLVKQVVSPLQQFSCFDKKNLIYHFTPYCLRDKYILMDGIATLKIIVCRFF